ncbi:MAG: EAL domain-containing protein [Rhizobiales bacterium]|nr:EAL domain-containing protein [Hyphomicrobiales bacterium]
MSIDAIQKAVDPELLTPEEMLRRLDEANERTQEEISAWLNANGPGEIERTLIRTLIDTLPDYLFVKDTKSRFVIVNQPLATDRGFDRASDLIGKTDFDIHPTEFAQRTWDCEQSVMQTGVPAIDIEERLTTSEGKTKWLSTTKIPLRDPHGTIIGVAGVSRDMTERKQAELLRNGQNHILEMVASNASLQDVLRALAMFAESQLDGILVSILLLDPKNQTLYHGAAPSLPESYWRPLEGTRIGPAVGSCGTAAYSRRQVIVPDITVDPLWRDYRDLATAHNLRSCWSAPIMSHSGEVLGTFALYSRSVRAPCPSEISLIETSSRVAGIAIERQRDHMQIAHLALHDSLTGLPNRTLLLQRLDEALARAKATGRGVTLAFVDLDNLKLINDTLGHATGDLLLTTLAGRMADCVRASDTVARIGGDEFVLLFADHARSRAPITAKIEALQRALGEPVEIDGQRRQVTASIGLASYPGDGDTPQTLLMNADAAMYRAKELGRNNCQVFTAEITSAAQERYELQEGLRSALANHEFSLVYQPQVDLASGRIFAAEALIRWQHPTLGMVPPSKFIPVAEACGLIVPIGEWVLRTACAQAKSWQKEGTEPIGISVNLSARQFAERNWVARVSELLEETGLEPHWLELELTESLIIKDVPLAVATMRQLRTMGVQLSIDDFGMGYSSLNALKSFPVARLKLDQSFVREIPNNRSDSAIAITVISLGHELNLKVIAEGVENASQLRFLREHGCDEAQGYFLSKPLRAEEIETLLRNANR